MNQTINSTIEQFEKDIAENNAQDNYAIILYKTKGVLHEQRNIVHRVYKSIDTFRERGIEEMNNISSEFGVTLQLWLFD